MIRRLAAVLAADVAGYSRLMHADEEGTHSRFTRIMAEVIEPAIAQHGGRVVKSTGDGFLAEFQSAVAAVRCAVQFQIGIPHVTAGDPPERRIAFRVGIHIGDVIVEERDIYGDGVNIAARLEGLADPGGILVSDVVHENSRGRVDCGFADLGEQQAKNIARSLRTYRVVPSAGRVIEDRHDALALPDKPSIAVLPFQNMSGDPGQEYFTDGMVEEIITALSRIRWLFVIARNSSFTYKGRVIDIKHVSKELGVRYVLEGSVRKGGDRVRITAQLIDASTDSHVWADRFDGALDDIFELQDRVASSVAGVIEPVLLAAEMRHSAVRPTCDLTAYDLFLRARALQFSWNKEATVRALKLLEQAIEREPRYGSALAEAASCHPVLHVNGWTDDPETNRLKGLDLSHRALQASSEDPLTRPQPEAQSEQCGKLAMEWLVKAVGRAAGRCH